MLFLFIKLSDVSLRTKTKILTMVSNLQNWHPDTRTLLPCLYLPFFPPLFVSPAVVLATLLLLEHARGAPVSEFPHSIRAAQNIPPPDICLALC